MNNFKGLLLVLATMGSCTNIGELTKEIRAIREAAPAVCAKQ